MAPCRPANCHTRGIWHRDEPTKGRPTARTTSAWYKDIRPQSATIPRTPASRKARQAARIFSRVSSDPSTRSIKEVPVT